MKILFSLLAFYCCIGVIDASSQARNLFRLIESKQSENPPNLDPWTEADIDGDDLLDIEDEDCSMNADKISALPGQPRGLNFNQYAGYVKVDKKVGKTLFYYFVESPRNPEAKPLVLWLNGGPGCSSVGNGAFEEQGPFRVNSDGMTLFLNPYAWNKVANVIFLESPAGVGFSYPNTSIIYNETGDKSTARDAYRFLVRWLHRFPHYKSRDFYISGESYAGHYVPELAYTVIHHNDNARSRTKINLKGIIFGNGVLNNPTDSRGRFDYLWTHALISDQTHAGLIRQSNCAVFSIGNSSRKPSAECIRLRTDAGIELGDINLYNIYYPLCPTYEPLNRSIIGSIKQYDPCSDFYVNHYLNNAKVQAALHARPTNWSTCSAAFNWTDSPNTVLPILQKLISSNLRVWIYSGDVDGVVPVTSTRYSIDTLKLPIKTPWRPWYLNQEVGGYVVEYKNLTFATVRGAGHEVPSYQPQRALALFTSYLSGILPPSTPEQLQTKLRRHRPSRIFAANEPPYES